MVCVAEHLGMLLSLEPTYLLRPTPYVGVDTADLGDSNTSAILSDDNPDSEIAVL